MPAILAILGKTMRNLVICPLPWWPRTRLLPLFQRLNTRYHWSQALLRKADALYRMGDYRAAADYLREGLAMAQAINRADAIFDGHC
ncbi:MAG: hypothetical protein R2867_36935 [Caldilineaceae bacterium]